MLIISSSLFEKFGCLTCGCDSNQVGVFPDEGILTVTCVNCSTGFVLVNDEIDKSVIEDLVDNGNEVAGDFCYPISFPSEIYEGYQLNCYVESIKAAKRISIMINTINKESGFKSFSCFVRDESMSPQIYINFFDKLTLDNLAESIVENNYFLTESIVKEASCLVGEKYHNLTLFK